MHALTGAGWAVNKERGGNSETNIFVKVVGCCYLLIWKKCIINTYCFTLA